MRGGGGRDLRRGRRDLRRGVLAATVMAGLAVGIGGAMADATTADGAEVARALDLPEQALELTPVAAPSLHNCTLLSALDNRVRGANAARMVGVTPDGLVVGGSEGAAARVLNACAEVASQPADIAQVVGGMAQPSWLTPVLDTRLMTVVRQLREANRTFELPTSVTENGAQVVRFLALLPDAAGLADITATWRPGGALRVQVVDLKGGD